jgi:4-amino-4-deoxy-L-arabinose transferase-like glycosyltransferase
MLDYTPPRAPRAIPLLDFLLLRHSSNFHRVVSAGFAGAILGICLFCGISSLGLTGPDEPRYAFIALEMSRTGDWITPRLYGQPWFEKPALYYWVSGMAFRAIGGNEWPARFPSALAALLTALFLAWIAKKLYGPRAAWLALLVFPTTVAGIAFSHSATPDMLFTAALALAMVVAAEILRRDGRFPAHDSALKLQSAPASLFAVFGLALGLATLAKGPAALILAGGSMALWGMISSQWRALWRFFDPVAIFAFAAVALPWYILCSLRNPDFFRTFILLHNFQRYLTPVFQHRQPFWFFLPITILALMPWSPMLLWVAAEGILLFRLHTMRFSAFLFFSCWAVFPILFFSASQSKLPGYILPAIPALTLLIAQCCLNRETPNLVRFPLLREPYAIASLGVSWMLVALSVHFWSARFPAAASPDFAFHLSHFAVATFLAGLAILLVALWGRSRTALALSCLCTAHAVLFAAFWFLPRADAHLSARHAAHSLRETGIDAGVQTCGLRRDWLYGLNFYLSSSLPECSSFPSAPPAQPLFLFVSEAGLAKLRSAGLAPRVLNQDSPEAILVALAPASH